MSNHTKAPWMFDGKVVYALNKKGVNVFSAFVQDGETDEDELKANARRIVACVNACEGISTEILEGNVMPVVFEPDTTANNLRVLLDVCERIQRKADVFDSMIGEEMGVGIDDWREFVDAVAAARQALDAKKGGAE